MFRSSCIHFQVKKIYNSSPFQKVNPILRKNNTPTGDSNKISSPNNQNPNQNSRQNSNQNSRQNSNPNLNPNPNPNQNPNQNRFSSNLKFGTFNEAMNEENYDSIYRGLQATSTKSKMANVLRRSKLFKILTGNTNEDTVQTPQKVNSSPKEREHRLPLHRLDHFADSIQNEKSRIFMKKMVHFLRLRLNLWARLFLPELENPNNGQAKKSFVLKGSRVDERVVDTVFYVPLTIKLFLIMIILGYFGFHAVMDVIEDTKQGSTIQDVFKQLVKSKIIMEYGEKLAALDSEGEENDVLHGLAKLTREEMILFFKAMNWYSVGHRTFAGRFQIGDSNPMVAAILLNSRLYIWMINLLADPSKYIEKGFADYEFIYESTEALNRFSHDETVAKKIVDWYGLTVLRHVRENLIATKDQNRDATITTSDMTYTADLCITSVDDLICRLLGLKWTHSAMEEEQVKALAMDMSKNRVSAEKLTKSLTGSWWTIIDSEKHVFERYKELREDVARNLRINGSEDLASKIEKNSLMADSVHELWTYTMKHRLTIPYISVASIGVTSTILATFFVSRWRINRKLSMVKYSDGYILPFVNAFSIFLTSLCAMHYYVLYPKILTEIRARVEEFEKDVNILFKGRLLPLCIHNYKIFSGYIGSFLLISALIVLATPSLAIIFGSTFSAMIAMLAQIYTTPNVNPEEFITCLTHVLRCQMDDILSHPQRILALKFIIDEDTRHHILTSKAVELREKASTVLKQKKREVHRTLPI